jgi:hypothetical protein
MILRIVGEDGSPMFITWPYAGDAPRPAGAVEVDRMPEDFEDFDPDRRVWVKNNPGQADWEAGPEHIAEARAQKRVEALLIRSGVAVAGGLLEAEAKERGIDLSELAELVLQKSQDFHAKELARHEGQAKGVTRS